MKTLFQIGDDIRALDELLFENDGDITDEQAEAAIDAWLAENREQLFVKLDSYCAVIQEREAIAAARRMEAARLSELASVDIAQTLRMQARLKAFLEAFDIKKVETVRFKLSLCANGGRLPLVVNPDWLNDPASAPEQYHITRIGLDTNAIREDLRNDIPVEKCAIGERGTHLRIK